MSEKSQETVEAAQSAIKDPSLLKTVVDALSGSSRRARQNSAAILSEIAKEHVDLLIPFEGEIIDALNRPVP